MREYMEVIEDRGQLWLMARSLDDVVPANSDVRVVSAAMDRLDWRRMESKEAVTGRPPYPPRVMAKLLVYAYSQGVYSSRRIEELAEYDVRYMWLAGELKPDFRTISRFRQSRWRAFEELFVGSVRLCAEVGLVLLHAVAADGTKVRANASRRSVHDREEIAKVRAAMAEAEATDAAEDAAYGESNGRELPTDLRDPESRRVKLDAAARELEKSGREAVSVTDPESRLMKTSEGVRPGYNAQAVVDTEHRVVVAARVTQNEHDYGALSELVEAVKANTECAPGAVLADTGFGDEGTLLALEAAEQEALIPPQENARERKRTDRFRSACFVADEERDVLVCPQGRELTRRSDTTLKGCRYRVYRAQGCRSCGCYRECVRGGRGNRRVRVSVVARQREAMRQKLKSEEGRAVYALRQQTIETLFGHLKGNLGFRRFHLRGVRGAATEWTLLCLAYNLKKWVRQVCDDYRTPDPHSTMSRIARIAGTLLARCPGRPDPHALTYAF